MLMQVEAGLSDLRQAYAELHEQLDSKQEEKPPEEQQRIRQHVSTTLNVTCAHPAHFLCIAAEFCRCPYCRVRQLPPPVASPALVETTMHWVH